MPLEWPLLHSFHCFRVCCAWSVSGARAGTPSVTFHIIYWARSKGGWDRNTSHGMARIICKGKWQLITLPFAFILFLPKAESAPQRCCRGGGTQKSIRMQKEVASSLVKASSRKVSLFRVDVKCLVKSFWGWGTGKKMLKVKHIVKCFLDLNYYSFSDYCRALGGHLTPWNCAKRGTKFLPLQGRDNSAPVHSLLHWVPEKKPSIAPLYKFILLFILNKSKYPNQCINYITTFLGSSCLLFTADWTGAGDSATEQLQKWMRRTEVQRATHQLQRELTYRKINLGHNQHVHKIQSPAG